MQERKKDDDTSSDQTNSLDQTKTSHINSSVRLESQPDPCLQEIKSTKDVLDKIKEVRAFQSCYSNAELYPRRWKNVDPKKRDKSLTRTRTRTSTFTILQFNVLAEGLSSGPNVVPPFQNIIGNNKVDNNKSNAKDQRDPFFGGFTDIPHPEISLDYNLRRWRILEVLLGGQIDDDDDDDSNVSSLDGGYFDIISVQEMDRYNGFFQPILHMFGYDSIFIPKQKAPGIKFGWYSDGCALFWKRSSFELIKEVRDSFDVGTQIYLIAILRHLASGQSITVATTHLKAQNNIQNEKIRTCQAQQLIQILSQHITTNDSASSKGMPLIVAGDFNSEPFALGNTCIHTILSQDFSSAYELNDRDLFTTWKTRGEKTVHRIIDYIFYKEVECVQILEIPDGEEMEVTKLPGFRFPSDHMSISARFELF